MVTLKSCTIYEDIARATTAQAPAIRPVMGRTVPIAALFAGQLMAGVAAAQAEDVAPARMLAATEESAVAAHGLPEAGVGVESENSAQTEWPSHCVAGLGTVSVPVTLKARYDRSLQDDESVVLMDGATPPSLATVKMTLLKTKPPPNDEASVLSVELAEQFPALKDQARLYCVEASAPLLVVLMFRA